MIKLIFPPRADSAHACELHTAMRERERTRAARNLIRAGSSIVSGMTM